MDALPNKTNNKIYYFLAIVIGSVLLYYGNKQTEGFYVYLTVTGFVLLMFGLYKTTTAWVKDNPRDNHHDDLKNE
ncbi:hypothetical protein [Leptobacterium sp. I13]|uniref:hypothetical protein n=1 Tax=Leptobacterium meishanense TaxID=3128904 RepID=UPI0030EE94AA